MAHRWQVRVLIVHGLVCFCMLASAQAEDYVLDELYGSGVHAYFSQDYETSVDLLTAAISEGSTDPRVYYFRGFAHLYLGSSDQAHSDFATGARYEVSKSAGYRVSQSLERVQGHTRLRLEEYRREASVEARRQQILRDRLRYRTPEPESSRIPADPDEAMTDEDNTTDPFTDDSADRPVGIGPSEEATSTVEEDAPAEADDETDFGTEDDEEAFGDDPAFEDPAGDDTAGDDTAGDDPFGEQEEMGDDEDPFDGEDDDDPFGETDDEDDPFEAGGDDDQDPFGGGDDEDPFGAEDDEDPFGP